MPRIGTKVLVFWKDHKCKKHIDTGVKWKGYPDGWHFAYYNVDGSNHLDDSQVTHWMPLPEPPIENKQPSIDMANDLGITHEQFE